MARIWNKHKQTNTTLKRKVFVGLSGGVDSAVSAALLVKEGHDVTGVFIKIALPGYPCPTVRDRQDAMRVAAHLRIPFRDIDLSKEYRTRVFDDMLREYERGHTPNPDTLCNKEIKFGVFFDYCMANGADLVATGHYARTAQVGDSTHLLVSRDGNKDQSYFLWMVPEKHLSRTLFPVGDKTKPQVRELAQTFGLPNATRKDSQGLCFLGALSIEDMLTEELHPTRGEVLSTEGTVIGHHDGALLYTLGQRHGFTVTHATSAQVPLFVIAKDIGHNTITVSEHQFPQDARGTRITLTNTNWIGEVQPGGYAVRYRYRQTLIPAQLELSGESAVVTLSQPHYVPVGQSLVCYSKERCIGGGVVAEARLC